MGNDSSALWPILMRVEFNYEQICVFMNNFLSKSLPALDFIIFSIIFTENFLFINQKFLL